MSIVHLYLLAKEHDFTPKNKSIGYKEDKFLWLCELQKWIRDKHKLDVLCVPDILGYSLRLYGVSPLYYIKTEGNNIFQTYEEALEEGLKQLLNKLEDE